MVVAMATLPWWPLSPWLWFIFFNAVAAAIAVMSCCAQQEQDGHAPSTSRRRLRRSASSVVLDRLRSFSLFSAHSAAGCGVAVTPIDDLVAADISDLGYYSCNQEVDVVPPPLVTQVSTVVPEPPRPKASVAGRETAVPVVTPIAPAAMAAAAETASAPERKDEEAEAEEEEQDRSISLDEAYAMVQQRRRPRQLPSSPAASVATTTAAASWSQKKKDLAAKGPKRRRGREAEEAAPEGKAELNARAELFIRQFREELKLQRLNSLLRHTHALGPRDGAHTTVR